MFLSKWYIKTLCVLLLIGCTGSKSYLKQGKKFEQLGMTKEAAESYYESLQRSPKNTDARVKLKQVGQTYVNILASDFFKNYNTQQYEAAVKAFKKLLDFTEKSSGLSVTLDYPQAYNDNYNDALEYFLKGKYAVLKTNISQKLYSQAINVAKEIKQYNEDYKDVKSLEIYAIAQPMYEQALDLIQNQNYFAAYKKTEEILNKVKAFKNTNDLMEICRIKCAKKIVVLKVSSGNEQVIKNQLFEEFIKKEITNNPLLIPLNNIPFKEISEANYNNSDNISLRKALGAEYIFMYDVLGKKETREGPVKKQYQCFQKVAVTNGTVVTTDYRAWNYNYVTGKATFSYILKYKLVDCSNGNVVASNAVELSTQDNLEYNEIISNVPVNINDFFPTHPVNKPMQNQQVAAWRQNFNKPKQLKTTQELYNSVFNSTIKQYLSVLNSSIKLND